MELSGKTLGVVGCGRIGQSVAQYAKALNMTVLGYDGALSAEDFRATGIKTSRLINDDTIAKCKRGVRIINCARGGIVDEAALLRGLESGHVYWMCSLLSLPKSTCCHSYNTRVWSALRTSARPPKRPKSTSRATWRVKCVTSLNRKTSSAL